MENTANGRQQQASQANETCQTNTLYLQTGNAHVIPRQGDQAQNQDQGKPTQEPQENVRQYCGWLRNPFRTTCEPWEATVCWYLQGNHPSRVSEVVQDFVHPQYHAVCISSHTQHMQYSMQIFPTCFFLLRGCWSGCLDCEAHKC